MNRSGHPVPDDEWLVAMAQQSPLWHQMPCYSSQLEIRNLTTTRFGNLGARGGELFERIRNRLLQQDN